MKIVEAIVAVLKEFPEGLTSAEVYSKIVKNNYYTFGAKDPKAVVNAYIRRRCQGLDFPTAFPVKLFSIVGYKGKKPLFALCSEDKIVSPSKKFSTDNTDILPEEKIGKAYGEHLKAVKQQVYDLIISNSPAFFEQLVMDLLLEMGYGYDNTAGKITGRSHDGGIDGIISEDKLGLDLIYIQAKRYEKKSIGRETVQAFAGAMENVQKGVFITTSHFTKEAIAFVDRQQKSIKLIDGNMLTELLLKYRIGINIAQTITLLKIDSDYYNN